MQLGLARAAGPWRHRAVLPARPRGPCPYGDAAATEAAFRAIAAEIAGAGPDPLLVHRTLRLTAQHAAALEEILREVADTEEDAVGEARYSLLLGIYQPGHARPTV